MWCLLECALVRWSLYVARWNATFTRAHRTPFVWLSLYTYIRVCRSIPFYAYAPKHRMETRRREEKKSIIINSFSFQYNFCFRRISSVARIICHMKSSISGGHYVDAHIIVLRFCLYPRSQLTPLTPLKSNTKRMRREKKKKTCSTCTSTAIESMAMCSCRPTTDANTCMHSHAHAITVAAHRKEKCNKKATALSSCSSTIIITVNVQSRTFIFRSDEYWAGSHIYIYIVGRQICSFVHSTSGGFWR